VFVVEIRGVHANRYRFPVGKKTGVENEQIEFITTQAFSELFETGTLWRDCVFVVSLPLPGSVADIEVIFEVKDNLKSGAKEKTSIFVPD